MMKKAPVAASLLLVPCAACGVNYFSAGFLYMYYQGELLKMFARGEGAL
jgi:hypothetical protein